MRPKWTIKKRGGVWRVMRWDMCFPRYFQTLEQAFTYTTKEDRKI